MSVLGIAAAAVALVLGCSNGMGDAGTIDTRSPAVANDLGQPETTRPPPTTTTPGTLPRTDPVTMPAPTSAPDTTTSTMLAETTTTLDPIAAEQAAVAAAAVEIQAVRMNAYINLDAPGNEEALDAHYTVDGVARAVVESDLQTLRDEGWRVRESADTATAVTVESVILLDGPPATGADVVVCLVDAGVVYEPDGGPGGVEAVVNDDVVASRFVQHLVLEAGMWKLEEVDPNVIGEWPQATSCEPS